MRILASIQGQASYHYIICCLLLKQVLRVPWVNCVKVAWWQAQWAGDQVLWDVVQNLVVTNSYERGVGLLLFSFCQMRIVGKILGVIFLLYRIWFWDIVNTDSCIVGYLYTMWRCIAVTGVIEVWTAKTQAGGRGAISGERKEEKEEVHSRRQETWKGKRRYKIEER